MQTDNNQSAIKFMYLRVAVQARDPWRFIDLL